MTTRKNIIKGYKVFNPNWMCIDFKYEVGKTYHHEGEISMCDSGFHFCTKLVDCFNYYSFNPNNKVAEIEAWGDIIEDEKHSKCVTNNIKIIKELNWHEVLDLVNTGKNNTGYCNTGNNNTGDYNTGHYNTGDYNIGDYNTGDYNTGYYNAGDCNTGYRNTGNYNAGNHNTGYCNTGNRNTGGHNTGMFNTGNYNTGDSNTSNYNTGDRNTGDRNTGYRNTGNYNAGNYNTGHYNTGNYNTGMFNTCNYSNGLFNTESPKIYMFNKPTDLTYEDFKNTEVYDLLRKNPMSITRWITEENMTEEEKEKYPKYITTGGYLKQYSYKEACKTWWDNYTNREKELFKKLPNFNTKVFEEITGIKID